MPDDSLAALKGGPRPANAEGHGGLQYDTRRDSILPTRPARAASNKSTPPGTTAPSPPSSLAPSSLFSFSPSPPFSLNSEADHRQQMGGGPLSTGGSRRPFPAPTSIDSDVDEGPPVPPKDPPEILPPPPLATSKVDEHGVDQQRSEHTGEPTPANSANKQISRPTTPEPHENLSPTPALNDACLPSAERPPPYLKMIESELCWLDDEDLERLQQGNGDFIRRLLEKIKASQGESDPAAPQSASPDLDAFLSSAKTQNDLSDPVCSQRPRSEKFGDYWQDLITLAPFMDPPATKEKTTNANDLQDDPPPLSKTGSFGEEESLKGEAMRQPIDEKSMLSNGSLLSCLLESHTGDSPALPEPIEPDRPPAYASVEVLPSGGVSITARPGDESTLQGTGTEAETETNTPVHRPRSNATAEESLHTDELVVPRPRPLSRVERALLRKVEFGSKANSPPLELS